MASTEATTVNIRNFCVIAHIDHGKSTLADRFLELTGAVEKRAMKEQFLDLMDLERERGITIKLQPVRLRYSLDGKDYILNLIDTPGHVDFSYEVSRSLAAVEGAILLVDATKGIQAQTLANLKLAQEQNLTIVPVINKVDLAAARIEEVSKEIANLLNIKGEEIFQVSAKTGYNVEKLLEAIIKDVPGPSQDLDSPLRALVFDSRYDPFKGIIAYVRIVDGTVGTGERIYFKASKGKTTVKEVGYFMPKETSSSELLAGEVGYIATGLKSPNMVSIGDTITSETNSSVEALEGYTSPVPVVFVSLYPQQTDDFDSLKDAVARLRMQDPSFTFEAESHEALGRGFRCGFLGVLHSEIISERIQREFGVSLVISRPSVEFRVHDKAGKEISIKTASAWPDSTRIASVQEPWVRLQVISSTSFYSETFQLLGSIEGNQLETKQLGEDTVLLVYEVPLREIIVDFYDRLKSVTKGMGSMDYEILDFRDAELVKLEVVIAGRKEEAFSQIVPAPKAEKEGRRLVGKLKELLPAQLFAVSLQAMVGGTIVARETIRARRKDVTAPLYGGDVTRKKKLLERQKKGKKELQEKGRVQIPPRVFLDIFRS